MNYLIDVPLRDRLLRVLDVAVMRADLTREEALDLLAAFDAPCCHEAAGYSCDTHTPPTDAAPADEAAVAAGGEGQ